MTKKVMIAGLCVVLLAIAASLPCVSAVILLPAELSSVAGGCNGICYNSYSCNKKPCNPGAGEYCLTCYMSTYQDKRCNGSKPGLSCVDYLVTGACGFPAAYVIKVIKPCPGSGWCTKEDGDLVVYCPNSPCTQSYVRAGSVSCSWVP